MSRLDFLLWVALPYLCIASFTVGHIWRYRRDQFMWTARSTQLLERRLLMIGSVLFHFGMLAAIGGHLLGILVPRSATEAVGISDDAYHWLAVMRWRLAASALVGAGIAVLVYRRLTVDRVAATTLRSDRILYPLLAAHDPRRDRRHDRHRRRPLRLPRDREPLVPRHLHAPARRGADGRRAVRLPAARRHGLAPVRDLAVHAPRPRLERPRHLPRPRTDPLPAPPPVTRAADGHANLNAGST